VAHPARLEQAACGQEVRIQSLVYYIMDAIYRDLRVTLKSLVDLENLRLKTIHQRQKTGAEE